MFQNRQGLRFGDNVSGTVHAEVYEPYFDDYVSAATIWLNESHNHRITNGHYAVLHSHGYYPPHAAGKEVLRQLKKIYNV
jgi:hypothetical protein